MGTDSTTEIGLEESIATLLRVLPGPVQAFILGSDRPRIAIELSTKYNLHVDQAGVLEQAFMYMLLGVSSPEEFVDALTKANIPAESVRGLAQDVNEQVFLPLRQAEQAGTPAIVRTAPAPQVILPGSNEPVPVVVPKPIEATVPVQVPPPPPGSEYQGQLQHVYGYIPQQMPPPMMYAPSYAVPPGYGAPVYMMPQQHPVQGWPQPPMQTQPLQPPTSTEVVSAPAITPAPLAKIVPPSPERIPAPAPQTQPKATLNPGAHIEKNYSADPYREPFTQ